MHSAEHLRETEEAFKELHPHWIDLESLRLWLQTCDRNHGPHCQPLLAPIQTVETQPQWLIDVQNNCLTPAKDGDRYAALSYVWGGAITTSATTSNISRLCQPGALLFPQIRLPRTIKHTMGLLKRLDIPYLWLDALCIVQDDDEIRRKQIHAMAWIYANAYVTIIAADGCDADHGLWGIEGVTGPRHLKSNTVSAIDRSLKNRPPIWYTRGWTFQELSFSRRKIMFHNDVVLWDCTRAAWNECRLNSVFKIPRWPVQVELSAWPDIKHYLNAVRSYNTRQFTFPQDALNAISSLLSVWRHAFDGSFITGLPQMFFHEALLWQPQEPLKRRISTADPSRTSPLPSWSWVGWEGAIDIDSWAAHFSHTGFYHPSEDIYSYQVTATVKWFYYDSNEGLLPIYASSLSYRPKTKGNDSLPEGWRLLIPALPRYEFAALEEAKAAYPLPLLDPPGNLVSASILSCTTKRGFFLADLYNRPSQSTWCDEVFLLDKYGARMGILRLNSRSLLGESWDTSRIFELVEIAGGEIPDSRWVSEWGLFEAPINTSYYVKDPEPTPIIYVLWIEWIEGFAYRRGLGRVFASSWKREALEEIQLILG
ncbi:heterokaryon incompatibility protein-domain-containing protein [Hypomontagnella monticulosa]|nr:heterokaryon incompatibility protein-domain-containing protein [Hypomontagnella monticulosa]